MIIVKYAVIKYLFQKNYTKYLITAVTIVFFHRVSKTVNVGKYGMGLEEM